MGTKVARKHIAPVLQIEGVRQKRTKGGNEVTAPTGVRLLAHKTGPLETPERSSGSNSWATFVANTLQQKPAVVHEGSSGPADLKHLVSPGSGLKFTNIDQAKDELSWVGEDILTVNVISKNEVAARLLRPRTLML
ncbi:unnamed protein product [Echinostoma caproni]|uniref:DUF4780 domain-containing protein n=1 Tax=Echinostoma caproni TaxID=27848 RepID=A0A183B4C5_9TREM|nr:unnamed protein product [Echinostoma caproni]